jgi:biopolymer transport protein ExbD
MAAKNVLNAAQAEDEPLNTTINTTPLVDVMLVLLIIFLVTIPVVSKLVPLTLPPYRNIATVTKPENIVIAVDKDEQMFWGSETTTPIDIPNIKYRLIQAEIAANAAGKLFPEVHIRGDRDVRFEAVGKVIAVCQQVGIMKVGFLTQPPPNQLPPA